MSPQKRTACSADGGVSGFIIGGDTDAIRKKKVRVALVMVVEFESLAAHLSSDGSTREGLGVAAAAARHAEEA